MQADLKTFSIRLAVAVFAFLLCGNCPRLFAQERVEVGAFVDYLGVSQTKTDNLGLGGRFGYRTHRVMIEGEVAYDYGINFNEAFRNGTSGNIAAIERTSVGVLHGLFGPALRPARGRFRPFVTLKAGFIDFRLSASLIPLSGLESAILGLRTSNLNFAIYPGAGVEPSVGPLGLRFEVGDDIYFNHGTHHNLRITFGPFIRF